MIKKTIHIGNPAYLSLNHRQLVIKIPEIEKDDDLSASIKEECTRRIPTEDIGILLLDHQQITITHGLIRELIANNCALVSCDKKGLPAGLLLSCSGNSIQTERYRYQIEASQPLKKQLWQQTVKAKIYNQAMLLSDTTETPIKKMLRWHSTVKSGDPDNLEARAAAYYWSNIFPQINDFTRSREDAPPNNLLNYGYAVLRAIVARALVASGLLPSLGIHHRNRYNTYCLADDVMEPYRPYVDSLIIKMMHDKIDISEITIEHKRELLSIPILDVTINGEKSPLMIAVQQTAASLARCYSGEARKIKYPEIL